MIDLSDLSNLSNYITLATGFTSLCAGVFSCLNWMNARNQLKLENEKISIELQSPGKHLTLLAQPRRKFLSRAEVRGLVGGLPIRGQQGLRGDYQINYMNHPHYYEELERVQTDGSISKIVIKCSREEIEQFDTGSVGDLCVISGGGDGE